MELLATDGRTDLADLREAVADRLASARETRARATAQRGFAGAGPRRELDAAEALVRAGLARPGESVVRLRLLIDIGAERRTLDEHDRRAHERSRVEVQRALGRLRRCRTSAELSRRAPAELRDACGFSRAMISRVRGTHWYPDSMRIADGADPDADDFPRFAGDDNEILLAHTLPETEMVRHRVPVIVEDAASDPRTYKPLVRVTQSTGYVAAPILAARRVIGFLHADRLGQAGSIASGDLDSISSFAAELGLLFERAVLAERMERQRSEVGAALSRTLAGLDASCDAEPALGAHPPSLPPAAGRRTETPAPRRDALLTAREREVLELVAAGATNEAVGLALVVSRDTVKSHVSSILRKLNASSRAEAVARYHQLRALDDGPRP